jgi:RNA polymerase sigma-70 factor
MENEALLFKKMQTGDWAAFNLFFKEYTERLYLYAVAFVKNRAIAEDIVQDSFIYLWTNRRKINFTGSVYAYLLSAVRNACINYKAHQQVEEKYRESIKASLTVSDEEEEWEELRQKVMTAIDRLPPKCREIFILGAIEGLKYQDIAEILGVSVNTVKTQMKSAYRKVKLQAGKEIHCLIMIALLNGRC